MKKIIFSEPNSQTEISSARKTSSFGFLSLDAHHESDVLNIDQYHLITCLYNNIPCHYNEKCMRDIKQKLRSYASQDKLKTLYDLTKFITYRQVTEKLFLSNLRCHYCDDNVKLVYKIKRCPKQWTLDRIMNDLGHNYTNVVISCLECNLSRRCLNSDKFYFTKNLNVIKT